MNAGYNKSKRSLLKAGPVDELKTRKYHTYYLLAALFFISALYFFLIGNYVFFYQENRMLFVFSCDYLKQFTSKPGGLLEYAGNFLSQGYFSNLYGSFILTVVLILNTNVFLGIYKKLSSERIFIPLFAVLTGCILILMQTNINFLIHNNLGILAAGLYFYITVSFQTKVFRISTLAFFPLFFWLTGAYAWIYVGMQIVYNISRKEVIYPVCLLVITGFSLLVFKEIIFLQPWHDLLYYPIPLGGYFSNPLVLWLFLLYFVLYPMLVMLTGSIKKRKSYLRLLSAWSIVVTLLLTVVVMSKIYNRDIVNMFRLEKMFFARDWDGVIKQQEILRSRNPVAEYYYNTALSEKDILCDRLFFAPQDFGPGSISIPWNSQISMRKLFRGAYFYYAAGLINEAHRWAFESMVTEGYHPENIKLLIKTDLINGHYKTAEKHIAVLSKTFHYRDFAKKYEEMVKNPELISSDPELGEKTELKPKDDFIIRIRNPEMNLTSLMQSNPGNRRAYEYYLAWLMLAKDFKGIGDEIRRLDRMNYDKIPRHIEEAAILLKAQTGPSTGSDSLAISTETQSRFSRYLSFVVYSDRTKSPAGTGIQNEFGNTFWYYLDFLKQQY